MSGNERWLPIWGLEGYYAVSSRGRVRSVDRRISGKRGHYRRFSGRVLGSFRSPNGYMQATLAKSGSCFRHSVHRLVLAAFVGPCPEGYEARHLDGDRANNKVENLRWGTRLENAADKLRHGTRCRGVTHGRSKLNPGLVIEIRSRAEGGETLTSIAADMPVGVSAVSQVVRRERWDHVE